MSVRITLLALFTFSVCIAIADDGSQLPDGCDYSKIKTGEPALAVEDILYRSIDNACSSLMDDAIKQEKPDALFKATKGFTEKTINHFSKWAQDNKGKVVDDEESIELKLAMQEKQKSLLAFGSFLKSQCPQEKMNSDACKARQAYAAFDKKLAKLFNDIRESGKAEQKALDEKALANNPEHKFKMKFCKNRNLAAVLFTDPHPIESNCIYFLKGKAWRLFVLQSIKDGVLVAQPNHGMLDKTIFIKTKQQYADSDTISNAFVKSIGLNKYLSVAGAQRTVNGFQYLGDDESDDNDF